MILIPIAAAVSLIVGVWCFITENISLSAKNAVLCKRTLLGLVIFGLLCTATSVILYNVTAGSGNKDASFARESFNIFALAYGVFILIGLAVPLLSVALKTKLHSFILVLLPLWSVIGFGIVYIGALWLSFNDELALICVAVLGVGGAALLAFPAFLVISKKAAVLSDRKKKEALIAKIREKKLKREIKQSRKKYLKEKKKKLKNPNR